MSDHHLRRAFVRNSVAVGAVFGGQWAILGQLPAVDVAQTQLDAKQLKYDDAVEPLVRLIERTDRKDLLDRLTQKIRDGLSYRRMLAALLLAGIRNVQPSPAVGFKFHCVLVVHSCHLASVAGPDSDRWLPLLWAADYFKSSQADEANRSGWTMDCVDESRVPPAQECERMFVDAMDRWDVAQADVATAGIARHLGSTHVFNLLATYAARDYRSIGHKAIYLANAWRTLQVIGRHHAEPVLRSLVFALLNHNGEPNPAASDLAADRPWRRNVELAPQIPGNWLDGASQPAATSELIAQFRSGSADDASDAALHALQSGVGSRSVWDGVFVGAGELLMRQPGIIGLHGLTTANAMHYLWRNVSSEPLRKRLLLQACAFAPMFRQSASDRGKLSAERIEDLQPLTVDEQKQVTLDDLFADVSSDPMRAARGVLAFTDRGGRAHEFVDAARRWLFVKGRNAHDYKFTSAVLEDYHWVSPEWRREYLAASVFNLKGSGHADSSLADRSRRALGA